MDIRFDGKRALVTGAGKGIGRGIAVQLAALGAKVHAISRTQADLDNLKQEVPNIEVYNIDVADWDKTRTVVESIGPIDLLVNNAGISNWKTFLEVTKEELDKMRKAGRDGKIPDIHRRNIVVPCVIAKGMVERGEGGAIVNMSSISGLRAGNKNTLYCSAKVGLDMLTRTMALELGPHQIRVNSVNPGCVPTPMLLRGDLGSPEVQEQVRNKTPLRKLAEVEDIVNATLFLLSDKSSMVNGIVIPVDGGIINSV